MSSKPLVLALSGLPGAGKSTIASLLTRRHAGARLVSFDKYQSLTRLSQTQIRDWFARGANPDEVDHSEIVAELGRATGDEAGLPLCRLVLFETPFGRMHRATGAFIDLLVWIDAPLDLALSRAMLAVTRNAQRVTAPDAAREFINWQIQYLSFYPTVRAMYLAQCENVARDADLWIDGSGPPEAAVEIIDAALSSRGIA